MEKLLLTAKEACEAISVSRSTLHRYYRQGKLRKVKMSRKNVKYSIDELKRLIEMNSVGVSRGGM